MAEELGANQKGNDMSNAAPLGQMEELQMSEPQIGLSSPTTVSKANTNFEDKAHGRVLIFDEKDFEEVIGEADELQSGSTGKVYCSKIGAKKKIIEKCGFRIIIKKIPCEGHKRQSVDNVVVAARMKHQGIVPLLAKTNSKHKDHAYFVFPFMENGDLMNAIREDMKRISKKEKVHMGARQRVLILYQIACAMCFIHTPVKDFRGAVFHGDVTTKNIVLDKEYNARLLDFGVARELEIGEDSIQSRTGEPMSKKEMSPNSDCTNFGDVILELLTREVNKDWELREEFLNLREEEFDTIHEECYERVWKNNPSVYDKLKNLASKCLEKETNSESLASSLNEILSEDFNFDWEWNSGKTTTQSSEETGESKKERCSLCIINSAVDDFHNLRLDGCVSEKKHISPPVCVACMRNSYLNPIMCVRCRGTIQTNIGNSWGAILVEGFAMDEDGVAFKNDVSPDTFEPTFTGKKETDSHFLGYFVAGKREIRFDLEEGNDHITIKNCLCEMSELRNLLLEKIVENILRKRNNKNFKDYWKNNEKRWQEFSSAIRVRITKGPHPEHTSELITIQQVVDAWNKMFKLEFGFRDIHNIEKGKVVVILEDMGTQQVIDMFRTIKDRYKDCLELVTVDEKTKVTIPNCTFGEQKRHTDVQVPKWLEKIIIRKKLKKAEKLIITIWPELGNERLLMEIPRTTTV